MNVLPTKLGGLGIIEPSVHGDGRGFFMEAFNKKTLAEAGIDLEVLQHNQSRSQKGAVRGLHFQWEPKLGKLIRVTRGRAWMVAVDIRRASPTLGSWEGREFSEDNKLMLWAPPGFATGFAGLEDTTEVEYYYTAYYNKSGESAILWSDPDIGIAWPIENPVLSERDQSAQTFKQWLARPESQFF